jgi:hypothetical protein
VTFGEREAQRMKMKSIMGIFPLRFIRTNKLNCVFSTDKRSPIFFGFEISYEMTPDQTTNSHQLLKILTKRSQVTIDSNRGD